MKAVLKKLLRFIGSFILCFLVIYLVVFFGGWRLFESENPIFIEMGVALVASIFFFAVNEVMNAHELKIKDLEERIKKLEDSR